MQIKLLKDLVEELAGGESSLIIDILINKKDVNEFLIAKKMNLTINQVRNILYKLSAEGLVSFSRKKDKRKGWYIYYWTLSTEKCLIRLKEALAKKVESLKHLLYNREQKRFYSCHACNIEVNEETALEHGFSCEECAEVYTLSDNELPVKELKLKMARTEKELNNLEEELALFRSKNVKKPKKEKEKGKKNDKKKTKKKKDAPKKDKKDKIKKTDKKKTKKKK